MPTTIKYSNNPNSDTAFVIQDGGQKNRTVLTAEPAGTLQLSDSANVSTGYVTDEDGKKHKVNLVAQLEGDIEFSENPNSTKGYATVDGKKHRVVLTASLHGGGGSAPVIDELNVTPSTSAQTITAPEGTDGYSPVNVAAVTNAIDANIVAGNIKKDVSILGVTGSYEGVAPSGTKQITTNGVHDVAGYANADVQVPTTAPDMYTSYNLSSAGVLSKGSTVMNFEQIKDVSAECLKGAFTNDTSLSGVINLRNLEGISGNRGFDSTFQGCTNITGVNLSSLTSVTGSYGAVNMFRNCTSITSVDMSSLVTVNSDHCCAEMFSGCSSLTGQIDLGDLTSISSYGCQYMFRNCTSITSVDMSSLVTANSDYCCAEMFSGCTGITSVNLSGLTTSSGYRALSKMFYGCTGLTSVSLPALKDITSFDAIASMFEGCTNLVSADLSALTNLTGNYCFNTVFKNCSSLTNVDISSMTKATNAKMEIAFQNCTSLTTIKFSSLTTINSSGLFYNTFSGCTSLTDIYFPCITPSSFGSYTNQFSGMLTGVTGCTIHFPSNTQARIETMSGYPNFGGTSTVVSFDLPATNTLTGADSNTYSRNPKYDTATALAWKVGAYGTTDFTPAYYTSGTTDPAVNDTIYSDSACTQVITSISSVS